MENIDIILQKYGWGKRPKKSNINFENLEEKIGFKLPEDYKYYVSNYLGNENFIGHEYVRLWEIEKEFFTNNNDYEIRENLKTTIGIGTNGAGEFIGIENVNQQTQRIILCPLIGMDEEEFIEIGSSFTDFLARLDMGKEWFA